MAIDVDEPVSAAAENGVEPPQTMPQVVESQSATIEPPSLQSEVVAPLAAPDTDLMDQD